MLFNADYNDAKFVKTYTSWNKITYLKLLTSTKISLSSEQNQRQDELSNFRHKKLIFRKFNTTKLHLSKNLLQSWMQWC